eukprot:TRINITY_DN888_c0_g1_i2.p1 TRINITY_DN888_c0_g1~~TRINITY_DN888_c0_g1_i2.p1  ORF type:complete len:873 (+),score=272.71 TRINITY_DN888_c0_g1_i2:339-2621(+)
MKEATLERIDWTNPKILISINNLRKHVGETSPMFCPLLSVLVVVLQFAFVERACPATSLWCQVPSKWSSISLSPEKEVIHVAPMPTSATNPPSTATPTTQTPIPPVTVSPSTARPSTISTPSTTAPSTISTTPSTSSAPSTVSTAPSTSSAPSTTSPSPANTNATFTTSTPTVSTTTTPSAAKTDTPSAASSTAAPLNSSRSSLNTSSTFVPVNATAVNDSREAPTVPVTPSANPKLSLDSKLDRKLNAKLEGGVDNLSTSSQPTGASNENTGMEFYEEIVDEDNSSEQAKSSDEGDMSFPLFGVPDDTIDDPLDQVVVDEMKEEEEEEEQMNVEQNSSDEGNNSGSEEIVNPSGDVEDEDDTFDDPFARDSISSGEFVDQMDEDSDANQNNYDNNDNNNNNDNNDKKKKRQVNLGNLVNSLKSDKGSDTIELSSKLLDLYQLYKAKPTTAKPTSTPPPTPAPSPTPAPPTPPPSPAPTPKWYQNFTEADVDQMIKQGVTNFDILPACTSNFCYENPRRPCVARQVVTDHSFGYFLAVCVDKSPCAVSCVAIETNFSDVKAINQYAFRLAFDHLPSYLDLLAANNTIFQKVLAKFNQSRDFMTLVEALNTSEVMEFIQVYKPNLDVPKLYELLFSGVNLKDLTIDVFMTAIGYASGRVQEINQKDEIDALLRNKESGKKGKDTAKKIVSKITDKNKNRNKRSSSSLTTSTSLTSTVQKEKGIKAMSRKIRQKRQFLGSGLCQDCVQREHSRVWRMLARQR